MEWYHLYVLFLICFLLNGSIHYLLDVYCPQKRFYNCDRKFILKQYIRFAPTIIFNLFLIAPFTFITMTWFGPMETDLSFSWIHLLLEQLFFAFWFETFFYFSHYFLHLEPMMTYIHYKHHQMVHSIGVGAVYCHPFEMLFSNYLPFALPIVLYHRFHWFWWPSYLYEVNRAHEESVIIWTIIAGTYIIFSHNGYPFPHSYPKHLVHHKNKFKNFGTLGIWDYLLNTDE